MIKFLEMCQRTQEEVQYYFVEQGFTKVTGGSVFVNENATITLVAHSDTVHDELPSTFKIDEVKQKNYFKLVDGKLVQYNGFDDVIISSPQGIGADDRTGCHIIDKIFNSKDKDKFNYLILEDEEIGLVGAKAFVQSEDATILNDTELFIEFDRAGLDFVTYGNGNDAVIIYLEDVLGVEQGCGSSSDIRELSTHYARPSLNLGVNYHKQHTPAETQSMNGIKRAISIAKALHTQFDGVSLEIDEVVSTPIYSYYGKKWDPVTKTYK